MLVPLKRKADDDGYRCICGFDHDDGFSIACDSCQRWSHAACYDIVNGAVPDEWKCCSCKPRPVNRDAAERLQRARQLRAKDGRRLSPGIDRKHRRIRHREPAETDEPSTHAFVPIAADIVHPDAREKLRRYAHHWRGITALADDDEPTTTPVALPPLLPPPTTLKQLPPQSPLSSFTNPSVLPPAYAVHTAASVRSHDFIAPYTSNVVPSSSYLADPLNAYAHLGMPKPFVHLIGPPLDLALDARQAGDNSRYLRSGCRPNAVLRPVLCPPDSLSFGVFATRDLKPNEEVILGWEWDDGNVVHSLPALIQSPHAFPSVSPFSPFFSGLTHPLRQPNSAHNRSSTFEGKWPTSSTPSPPTLPPVRAARKLATASSTRWPPSLKTILQGSFPLIQLTSAPL